ncbi:hypothetical protein NQD34_002315 [Periophthalmus magnuspinnatus]|uniref:putative uncharacterized protein DDB_G0282133 n=1 Tax=Periophthalmus magnuspinnatus TaxID=409849 RepID=UPI00145B105A|nr:putative uncharacterized protein DDB_G0282133 [Periophthalmus magnuspinnatus]KAJ0032234.1 hypothetical protein NQD34_002315 [Periophthalmus magnuspinnatus]
MPIPQGALLCLGLVLTTVGVVVTIFLGLTGPVPLFGLGVCLSLGGVGILGAGFCRAMKKHLVPGVPGHFLLHPRTGTRFSPQQGLAIQRRLDRIRREMSSDSVSRGPEPDPPLPSTPPPWTMEPPPSYDTVMKSQGHSQEHSHEHRREHNHEHRQEHSHEHRQEHSHEHRQDPNREQIQEESWRNNEEESWANREEESWVNRDGWSEQLNDCSTVAEDSNQC